MKNSTVVILFLTVAILILGGSVAILKCEYDKAERKYQKEIAVKDTLIRQFIDNNYFKPKP